MRANSLIDIGSGILVIAAITAVVSSKNTASIITASGSAFKNVILASLGKG